MVQIIFLEMVAVAVVIAPPPPFTCSAPPELAVLTAGAAADGSGDGVGGAEGVAAGGEPRADRGFPGPRLERHPGGKRGGSVGEAVGGAGGA